MTRGWSRRGVVLVVSAAIVLGALAPGIPPAFAQLGPRVVTCASCLVVADESLELWARNDNEVRPNASTTKMATALVVVRSVGLQEVVTVSQQAASAGGGGLDLRTGDRFSVSDLLYALLLSSSNDAAVALAEHVSGTEAAFVQKMNRLARELGLLDTRFVNSHGLDAAGHYSTASDLARLALALLRSPRLAPIVGTADRVLTGPSRRVEVVNRNPLIGDYRGATGVKTGTTDGAGNVLVAAAQRYGRRLIVVAMDSTDAARDARRLLDYGFKVLQQGVILDESTIVGSLVFDPSGTVDVVAAEAIRGPYPLEETDLVLALDPQPGPLIAGQLVGRIELVWRRKTVGQADAIAVSDVPVRSEGWLVKGFGGILRAGRAVAEALGAG